MRLDIPAGTAVRFEPGETRGVDLVALGGSRRLAGLNGLVGGDLDRPEIRSRALAKSVSRGFKVKEELGESRDGDESRGST
jgi:hypothetical protein